jgi:3-oxoacyl-[acyl-carrier protein] reductase
MILITGASRGIGKALGERFVASGHEVIGISRTSSNQAFPIYHADVTSKNDLKSISRELKSKQTKISILINAAGIASMNLALLASEKSIEEVIKTNLIGTIYSCQVFSPFLIKNKSGCIINFSTIAAAINLEGESIYAASKAGIENFTKTLAKEISGFNIRANCIAPGPIQTDLLNGVSEKQIRDIYSKQIFKEQFSTSDVCDVAEILISEKSRSLSGHVFNIGGVG